MNPDTLVIVAGHSIFIGESFNKNIYNDENWLLFPFQKGEPKLYIEHIKTGCDVAKEQKDSMLIFTGTQTRRNALLRSESQTYWEIARSLGYIDEELMSRTTTEEFSRDSFENLLFSICRFREFNGYYPKKIRFVTFAFKEKRFWLHANAIRFPKENVEFYGVNNPDDIDLALKGETNVLENIKNDPYQANGDLLIKRNERNPFRRQNGYMTSCPELIELLKYSGTQPFPEKLPWE